MNDTTVDSLREALKHSPDNAPLRLLLAETGLKRLKQNIQPLLNYLTMLKQKLGWLRCFLKRETTLPAMLF